MLSYSSDFSLCVGPVRVVRPVGLRLCRQRTEVCSRWLPSDPHRASLASAKRVVSRPDRIAQAKLRLRTSPLRRHSLVPTNHKETNHENLHR